MNKLVLTTLAIDLCAETACAQQRRIIIADMESRLPVPGAVVATDRGERAVTDHTGTATLERTFRSATVSAKNYMQRRVGTGDMAADTLTLIPQQVQLKGVVVTAPKLGFDVQEAMRGVKENAALPKPGEGANLLGIFSLMFPSKKQTRAQKIKKILEKY